MKGHLCPDYRTALRIKEPLEEDCKVNLLLHFDALLFQIQAHLPGTFWAVRQKVSPIFPFPPAPSSAGMVCWLCFTSVLPEPCWKFQLLTRNFTACIFFKEIRLLNNWQRYLFPTSSLSIKLIIYLTIEQRSPVVRQNPTLLGSVLIGMKAFVPESWHSLSQNIMCKTDRDKHTKQDVKSPRGCRLAGEQLPQGLFMHMEHFVGQFEISGPHLGCTVTLLTQRRDSYKEREVEISSLCSSPNCITTGYLSICRTQVSTSLRRNGGSLHHHFRIWIFKMRAPVRWL